MADSSVDTSNSLTLQDLSVASRVLIAAFLITVGIGYFSALVQLHMQHASPGEKLPTPEDVVQAYHGSHGVGTLERLIVANETLPFNGSGSMRAAFTVRSSGWVRAIRDKAKALMLDPANPHDLKKAEKELRKDRELEIESIVQWIHAGGNEADYNAFQLPDDLAKRFPTDVDTLGKSMFERDENKQVLANIQTILNTRCYRCHSEGKGGAEGEIHLDKFEVVKDYVTIEYGGGMSLRKLAQSTHVHMLGFGMLYGLTGLIFSLTTYPVVVRLLLAPFPLIMQVIDISCWWLARLPDPNGPLFAQIIPITGGLVGLGLLAHIVGGSLNLFGTKGKMIVVLLFVLGGAIVGMLYLNVIGPYLGAEAAVGPASR